MSFEGFVWVFLAFCLLGGFDLLFPSDFIRVVVFLCCGGRLL